jgi:hypothetical protein
MANIYRVEYHNPKTHRDHTELLEAISPIHLKDALFSNGLELRSEPILVSQEKSFLENLKDRFDTLFAVKGYNPDIELAFLKGYSDARRDGHASDGKALEDTRYSFGRSNKVVRQVIDDLIVASKQWGIKNLYDLFVKKEEFFSPMFLTLLRESLSKAETDVTKIISNPNPDPNQAQVGWYVELTESILELRKEMINAIKGPIIQFVIIFSATMAVLTLIMPNFLKAFSKVRDISKDDYTFVGNTTIAVSQFLTGYGIWVLIAIIAASFIFAFFMKTNESFRHTVHRSLLRAPLIGDILTAYSTKVAVSFWAMFNEAGLQHEKTLPILASVTSFLPIQYELQHLAKRAGPLDFEKNFETYSQDEKYFTEMFYAALTGTARAGWYGRAFGRILANIKRQWDTDLKNIPIRLGGILKYGWLFISTFFVAGLLIIFVMTVFKSA